MLKRLTIILLLSMTALSARADYLEAQLWSDYFRIMYGNDSIGQNAGRLELAAGYLYSSQNTTSDYLLNFDVGVRGESLDIPVLVSVAGRVYYGRADDKDVGGLGIGGSALYAPENWKGFGIGGYLYWVPEVISFGDSDGMLEYGITANYQINSQARVVLGWQDIGTDLNNDGNYTIADGLYLGINMAF